MAANTVWCIPLGKIRVREITLFGILGAMTFAAKYVMSGLPNIEPVTLMVMVFGAVFGRKAVYPVYLYVVMELLFFGLGSWNFMYLYIWAVPMVLAWVLKGMEQPLGWAVLSGAFGLLFGALCMPVDMVIGGGSYALTKWVSGIPFDITHCTGNFVIALVLFLPLRRLTERLYAGMKR